MVLDSTHMLGNGFCEHSGEQNLTALRQLLSNLCDPSSLAVFGQEAYCSLPLGLCRSRVLLCEFACMGISVLDFGSWQTWLFRLA